MRKSLLDIKHMVKKIPYNSEISEKLKPYHYYLLDAGHSIMCVIECHLTEAQKTNFDDYELPVPVRYVLEKGYKFVDGYIVVNAEYNSEYGLDIDEKYFEF